MDEIYFYTINGDIVSNNDIAKTALISQGRVIDSTDFDIIREYVKFCKGIKEEIKEPTVEMFLKA